MKMKMCGKSGKELSPNALVRCEGGVGELGRGIVPSPRCVVEEARFASGRDSRVHQSGRRLRHVLLSVQGQRLVGLAWCRALAEGRGALCVKCLAFLESWRSPAPVFRV